MINIVCLKWGNRYGPEYVNRLYAAVCRNTSLPFKFHCFTDDTSNIHSSIITHALPYKNLQGWWNKLFLFSNEINIPRGEEIFYIDLDTLITRNINTLLYHPSKSIIVLRDFLSGMAKSASDMGSGLMKWRHGEYTHVWDLFIMNSNAAIKMVEPHGDQQWINLCVGERLYWQNVAPGKVVSFKLHCLSGLPAEAAIVCYHGRPSIPESAVLTEKIWLFNVTPQPWVLDYWRE